MCNSTTISVLHFWSKFFAWVFLLLSERMPITSGCYSCHCCCSNSYCQQFLITRYIINKVKAHVAVKIRQVVTVGIITIVNSHFRHILYSFYFRLACLMLADTIFFIVCFFVAYDRFANIEHIPDLI